MALVLPKYVAFKGDNNNYLCLRMLSGSSYLQFSTKDIGDSTVTCEIVPVANGQVRIKQISNGKFWRRTPNWIWADSDDTSSNNKDTLFRAVKVDDQTIALMNVGNGRYCKRLTAEQTSCLSAGLATITLEAKLNVEEPVTRREIYDIKYNFDNAKIYGETVISVGQVILSNNTNKTMSMNSEIKYEDTKRSTWNTSFSLKSNVKATAQAVTPEIVGAKVVPSQVVQAGIEWGKTETKIVEIKAVTTVSVPPKNKAIINLVAKQGTCDVTFTYNQRDTLSGGFTVITECRGVFTGTNMYSTTFGAPKFEPL